MHLRDAVPTFAQPATVKYRGKAPIGTVTLEALGDFGSFARLTGRLSADLGVSFRTAPLLVVQQVLGAITNSLITPSGTEGAAFSIRRDQLGLVLIDGRGIDGAWVGQAVPIIVDQPAEVVGACAMHLFKPIAAQATGLANVTRASLDLIAYDAIEAECRRLERVTHGHVTSEWTERVLAGTGYHPPIPARTIVVRPDAGPAVRLPMRRVCCMLQRRPFNGCCPACPLGKERDVVERATVWLTSLDPIEFERQTGRPIQ